MVTDHEASAMGPLGFQWENGPSFSIGDEVFLVLMLLTTQNCEAPSSSRIITEGPTTSEGFFGWSGVAPNSLESQRCVYPND